MGVHGEIYFILHMYTHHLGMYVTFGFNGLWPTFWPTSLSKNSLDTNHLVYGAYLGNSWIDYIHITNAHHLEWGVYVPFEGSTLMLFVINVFHIKNDQLCDHFILFHAVGGDLKLISAVDILMQLKSKFLYFMILQR